MKKFAAALVLAAVACGPHPSTTPPSGNVGNSPALAENVCGPAVGKAVDGRWDAKRARSSREARLKRCVQDLQAANLSAKCTNTSLPAVDVTTGTLWTDKSMPRVSQAQTLLYSGLVPIARDPFAYSVRMCERRLRESECLGDDQLGGFVTAAGELCDSLSTVKKTLDQLTSAESNLDRLSAARLFEQQLSVAGTRTLALEELAAPFGVDEGRAASRVDEVERFVSSAIERLSLRTEEWSADLSDVESRYDAAIDVALLLAGRGHGSETCAQDLQTNVRQHEAMKRRIHEVLAKHPGHGIRVVTSGRSIALSIAPITGFAECKTDVPPKTRELSVVLRDILKAADVTLPAAQRADGVAELGSARSRPTTFVATGFSDQQPLIDSQRCPQYTTNLSLAIARAESVRDAVLSDLKSFAVVGRARGRDDAPERDCSRLTGDALKECHTSNRRVSLLVTGGPFDFPVPSSCLGKKAL